MVKKLTPMSEDFNQWYTDIIQEAELADYSPVKGTMVIRPYGYALWEHIQSYLDKRFKETGHENAYFPLFIPKSFIQKEAEHVEGFSPELATVTHAGGKELEEPLIVRPTSETIINHMFAKWIKSHRDLPMLINQWANVVRWEMRTRLFLRTSEFLWQEGHTAHATKEEAINETKLINDIYSDFAEKFMAMPVVKGYKSESERFAGAEETLCIEALMQDGKALQAGTSHFLGQNFAKAFDVKYADKSGKLEYVWATSWGVSTRLMGALIMSHSDDIGLVLPPLLAPIQIIIIPLIKSKDDPKNIIYKTDELFNSLKSNGIRVKIDNRDNMSLGFKLNDSEVKGIPMRVVIGEKEIENNQFEVFYRHNLKKEPTAYENILELVSSSVSSVQSEMISESKKRLKKNTHEVNSYDEFKDLISNQRGFVIAGWDGSKETEEAIKIETKATIRCIPEGVDPEGVKCVY